MREPDCAPQFNESHGGCHGGVDSSPWTQPELSRAYSREASAGDSMLTSSLKRRPGAFSCRTWVGRCRPPVSSSCERGEGLQASHPPPDGVVGAAT